MNEQLRELVQNRLSGAVNCPAKEEIVEEITADRKDYIIGSH